MHLEEGVDGFHLILDDAQVIQITLDHRFGIIVQDGEDDRLHILIENTFAVRNEPDSSATMVNPEAVTPDLGELSVSLRFQGLRRCDITQSGVLMLEFESGLTIETPPDIDYEAWDLDHKLFKIVAMAGGELAVWDRGFRKQKGEVQ